MLSKTKGVILETQGQWPIATTSPNNFSNDYIDKETCEANAALIIQAVNEYEINEKARLTLEGLTPGGSE